MNLAEYGASFLWIALLASLAQLGMRALRDWRAYERVLPALALGTCLSVTLAFAVLLYAFAVSDFSLLSVYKHSHTLKPLIYKVTGAWGHHEGSMVLWCWILTLYSAALTLRTSRLPTQMRGNVLHIMGGIQAAFLAYTILTSSPFQEMMPVPQEGQGLNPLLQDVGLAIHPPMLYLGYVGFAGVFALAAAALPAGRVDADFARLLHPWIMVPWAFLTLGIGLGSWWAYRELGWGGWWFWDPVENASLLPWLTATALFHANVVMMRRGNLQRWVMLLALLTFMLSLLGTFLVRSGLLTSVHSFASAPTRGVAILAIMGVIAGFGMTLYWRYGERLQPVQKVVPWSREMAILINNLVMVIAMVAVLLAMLYPLLVEMVSGRLLTIGTDYYNQTFAILTLPVLAVCAISTALVWGGRPPKRRLRRQPIYAALSLLIAAWLLWQGGEITVPSLLGAACGCWILLATLMQAMRHIRREGRLGRLKAMVIGHAGLAIFVIAVSLYSAGHQQFDYVMRDGEEQSAGPFRLTLDSLRYDRSANYLLREGTIRLTSETGGYIMTPEERYYPVEDQHTTEAAVISELTRDLYAVIKRRAKTENAEAKKPAVLVQFHINPAMNWIWGGFALAALSGFVVMTYGRGYCINRHPERKRRIS